MYGVFHVLVSWILSSFLAQALFLARNTQNPALANIMVGTVSRVLSSVPGAALRMLCVSSHLILPIIQWG